MTDLHAALAHSPWLLDGARWACKHPDPTGRYAWTSPPCADAIPPPCFCGCPDDRERVHRAHACEPWVRRSADEYDVDTR